MTRRLACVLGFPVTHSLSPKLHGFWLRQYNIAGEYKALPVRPEALKDALDGLVAAGYAGCNITLPFKELALDYMDALDDSARVCGAVNTVVIRNGKKTGYNSDGFGFMESLKAQYPQWAGGRVAIYGAGGAARGIIAALQKSGVKNFSLANRTQARAEKLAQDLGLENPRIAEWKDRARILEDAALLVNATHLGMEGQPALDADISFLPKQAAVCDIVYRPLETPLLRQALQAGHPVIKGLPMLLHQGRLGFREWFGTDPAVTPALYEEIAACAK